MKQFPDLKKWFNISKYYKHKKCRAITLLLKDTLSDNDLQEFANEFTKLICRIRCNDELKIEENGENICKKFQDAVDGNVVLKDKEKCFFSESIFFEGIISQKKYDKNEDYKQSIDNELFNGYFGEVLFYIVRKQILEDEKIMIEPNLPKPYSKEYGLDYVEIRKSIKDKEYYFIIGEVKTTKNTIGNYPDKIIGSLNKRTQHLFIKEVNAFKERVKYTKQEDLKYFIDSMSVYFLKKTPRKKFAGVINYGSNTKHKQSVFQNFFTDCAKNLDSRIDCRKIKLIGIKDIENMEKRVLDCIWKTLSI